MEELELVSLVHDTENDPNDPGAGDVNSDSELEDKYLGVQRKSGMKKGRAKLRRIYSRDTSLKREFSLSSSVGYVVGMIIGSGIFITPQIILCRTGSFGLSLIVWIIGGVASMAGGFCFIELGLLIKKSGGEYNFIKETYTFKNRYRLFKVLGLLLSFLYIWTSVFVVRPFSIAVIALTSAQYLIKPFYTKCDDDMIPRGATKLLSLAIISILGLINCYSLKLASKVMSVFAVAKILALLFIAVIGVIVMIKMQTFPSSFVNPFEVLPGQEPTVSSVGLSFYSVLWAYDGWNVVCYATEETMNVNRNMPLSLMIGIPIVTLCYMLVNISFFAVLDYNQILSSETVALPFGDVTIGTAGLVIIPLLVSLSTFSSANGSLFSSSRVVFVAAREGHLPEFLSGVHCSTKIPIAAILIQIILSMFMVTVGTVDQLIDGLSFVSFIFYALCIVAVLILRITHHNEPRLFKVWFIVPVAVITTCFCLFVVFAPLLSAPIPLLIALGFMVLGVPVYFFLVMDSPWKLRPGVMDKLSDYITTVINKTLNTVSARI